MVRYVSSGNKTPAYAVGRAISQVAQLIAVGQMEQARALLVQLSRQAPDHPDVLHLAGHMELAQGRIDSGVALIKQAIKRHPSAPMYHYNLGLAFAMKKDFVAAKKAFQQAVRLGQRDKDTLDNLAICQQQLGRLKEAKTIFEEVARQLPEDAKSWLDLARINLELNSLDEVQESLVKAEQLSSSGPPENWKEIVAVYMSIGPMHKAVAAAEQGLALSPEDRELWYLKGQALYEHGDYARADAAYHKADELGFDRLKLQLARARLLITSGQVAAGRELLDGIHTKVTNDVSMLLAAAQLYSLMGIFNEEEKCLLEVQALDAKNINAQAALALVPGRELADEAVAFMESHIDDAKLERRRRYRMGFALGNHFRHLKEYDKAFRYYKKGNQLKGYSWDRTAYRQWVNRTIEIYDQAFFEERAAWGSDSRMPLLIVGMPRSGTTLSEQIISSHSRVLGAGEFGAIAGLSAGEGVTEPQILHDADSILSLDRGQARAMAANHLGRLQEQVRQGEDFVTNKLPHNFQQVGLFGLMFPEAPIIHVRRDPRDNLLSIYFQNFSGYHPYAYDLKNLAFQYWEQERLMQHWKSVIPNPVFNLNYEELVGDLQGMIGRLADFLGLTVEDAMKKFYEQERQVQTASKWQVRQKLYTTSMARWKPYEKELKPLFDALREFAPAGVSDEYGLFKK